ncbi:SpvB/TcaC N-terminal domain-containing protein [Tahibacter harae]|uniref:FG-GAP-like repeat-containing protein n=1 Tax=Tahibacter harae TaxID=2963937 RepID=A0ABT1QMK3_9GAMM|nr:SpvB/TcaC N-terminal domain-containing protein [Tahibacter harae]MCQ4163764.1 FG-GAP-like repeat-containing protein [Tahibacter harae]
MPVDPETGQESAEVPNLPQADPEQVAAADLPAHDEPAGTLAGEAGVDGGAAIYSVPLAVPPGRAGMQPALGLAYSSRNGNSIAGVGWTLTGTSSLHRCPRTPEQDGETRGVSYDNNDRLCLDGQRLIAVTAPGGSNPGTYGAAGTHYRTEIDSFVRVIQVGGNLAGNSACFRVEEKSGRILHYGAVASGTDPAAPTTCTSATSARVQPSGAAATLSWLLEKVEDRVGNNMRYEYTVYGAGENLLKQVLYTGLGAQAGDRKVVIDYSARIDIGSSYLDGGLTEQTQKLSKITTKIGDTTVRTLTPAYVSGTFSDRLLLKELTECANRNTTGTTLSMVCHPKTVFGWNDGTPNVVLSSLTAANLPGASTGLPAGGGVAGSRQLRVVGDLDGDGARETVLAVPQGSGSTADVYLVQLAADRSVRAAVNFTGKLSVLPERYADMDGDGRAEVLSLPAIGAPQVVSLGIWTLGRGAAVTANAFHFVPTTVASPASVTAGSLFTADVGGDGKLDLITTAPAASCGSDVLGTKTGVFIHTNAMTGRLSTSSTTASFTSSATPLFCLSRSATTSTNVTLDERIERIADFNGDGLPDFFISNNGTGNNKTFSRILLGQGVGTPQSISCSSLGSPALSTDECDRAKGYVAQWQDINGDGLDDFVFAKPGGNWQLRLNKGGSLGALITTASNAGLKIHTTAAGARFRYADRLPAMDVDNDGKTDLLAVTGDYQGFAMKMCVAALVGQLPSGECPDSTRDVEAGQCLAYACPQDPGSGTLNMPANGVNTPGYPAVWKLPGGTTVPVFAMYDSSTLDFSGNDQSAYYVDQLKFVQTGPSSFTVQNLPTAMVTKLQQSAADDVFGDGLSDLVTELGCQFKQITHNGANQPGCLVIGESATYGNSYGPTHLPNGRPVSDFNAILSGGSYISVLEAAVNENRGVYLSSNGEGRNTDVPLDLGPEAPVAAATAAASPVLPDVLRNATDGMGDIAAWNLVAMAFPAVQNQIPLYSVPSDHGYADSRHYYFASTMPVVTGFAQHSGLRDSGGKPDMSGWRSAVYGYREAMYNHFGRGFQGFRAIVSDSAFNQATKQVRTTTTFQQKFPLTGRVESVVVTVPNTTQRISEELNTWKCGRSNRGDCLLGDSLATPTGLVAPFLDQQRVNAYEPDSGVLSHHTLTVNAGSVAGGVSGWDNYGNLVEQLVIQADDGADSFLTEHSTRTVNVYDLASANIAQWWTDRLNSSSVTRQISYAGTHSLPSGASAPAQTVIADTSWNADRTLLSRSIQSGVAGQQSTTSYSYTSGGLPSQVVVTLPDLPAADPSRVRTVNYTYSRDGENPAADGYFVLDTSNALSQVSTTKTLPRDGQVREAKDPNNIRTTTTYDAFGRATRVDYVDSTGAVFASPMQMALTRCTAGVCGGGAAAEDFTPAVAVLRQTTVRAGYPTTIDWTDVLGRSVKQASGSFAGDFSLTLTTYDLQGKVASQSTPFFKTQPVNYTSLQYDRVGRLTQKTAPGSSLDVTNGNVVSSYTYTGRKTKVMVRGSTVMPSGGNCPAQPALPATAKLCLQVERSNDARGALMQTKDAAGLIVDYWTDAQGQVAAIKDDTGLITATYNALGHRLTSKDPDQGYWQFESNALGELLKQTDSRGAVTRVTVRDVLGRVKQQTTVPPTVVPAGMDANAFHDEWEYDPANALGALYRVTRRRGANVAAPETNTRVWRETYTYDSAARVIDTATSINEGSTTAFSRTQSYDPVTGRPLTRVYASGLAVKTEYTAYGQPSKLSNAVNGFVYWAATAHNAWGQVSGENLANGISGTYATDLATGQPTQRRWTKGGVPLDQVDYTYDSFANLKSQLRAGNAETYAYDVRQRLVRSSRTSGGIVDYRYAPNGNLERKTDYSADVANAYTYGLGVDLGNGNCGPHAATNVALPGSGLDTYTCDRNGNVVGGNTLSLRFAADNRPVYSARPSASGTTQWAYSTDGFRYYALSSRGVTYFDREGYESTGAVVRHELGPVIVERQNGIDTVTAVLTDRLGSTIATVDTTTQTRAYDAFGQVRNGDLTNKPNGTLNLPGSIRGFTQHEHADDVRLIHMKGRLYDYQVGAVSKCGSVGAVSDQQPESEPVQLHHERSVGGDGSDGVCHQLGFVHGQSRVPKQCKSGVPCWASWAIQVVCFVRRRTARNVEWMGRKAKSTEEANQLLCRNRRYYVRYIRWNASCTKFSKRN